MRQRLRTFLPIVLIALAVQILAPIASSWAAAIAASDPLRSIEICHNDSAPLLGQADQGADPRAQDGACSICCLAQASASFNAPWPVTFAVPYPDAAPVLWSDDSAFVLRSRNLCNAQARGPPQLT